MCSQHYVTWGCFINKFAGSHLQLVELLYFETKDHGKIQTFNCLIEKVDNATCIPWINHYLVDTKPTNHWTVIYLVDRVIQSLNNQAGCRPSTQTFPSRLLNLEWNFMMSPNGIELSLARKPILRSLRVLRSHSREEEHALGLDWLDVKPTALTIMPPYLPWE